MAEIFIEQRIGETRAAVCEAGGLIEMHVARDGDGAAVESRWGARLKTRLGGRGIALLHSGEELLVEPWPAGFTEGALVELRITRQAWREPGRNRLAKARPLGPASRMDLLQPAPDMLARLKARGFDTADGWPQNIAAAWDEAWEAAELGLLPIAHGSLSFTPTPAGVAVDVDGTGPTLVVDAATAVARAVRLWGLGGSILIDLPTRSKADRQAAAAAVDAGLAGLPFERTTVNGFGLLQLVVPRHGPSILERARLERDATAALGLLMTAAAEPRPGALAIIARPEVAYWLQKRPHLLAEAARRAGRRLDVVADPMAKEGHVETRS